MKPVRTTLTLDPDVAAELRRLRRQRRPAGGGEPARERSFKSLVNEVLRLGLQGLARKSRPHAGQPLETSSVDLGRSLLALDDVAEALAIAEGEAFK